MVMDETERKHDSSPGDTTLANAAGVQVADLGLFYGPTVHSGLIAEAAAEAWSTRATLAHTPTARTVVTETMDTATVCREEMGTGKLRQGQSWLGTGNGVAGIDLTSGSQNQRPSQTQWAGRRNASRAIHCFQSPHSSFSAPIAPSESSSVCLT